METQICNALKLKTNEGQNEYFLREVFFHFLGDSFLTMEDYSVVVSRKK